MPETDACCSTAWPGTCTPRFAGSRSSTRTRTSTRTARRRKSLDDILGYHYYTELAHSAGMSQAPLGRRTSPPRERVRAILGHMDRFDNTVQYGWFLEIARTFLGFQGDRVTAADADALFDAAEQTFAQPDWEKQVLATIERSRRSS